jgi:negative regulator of sigma E activity
MNTNEFERSALDEREWQAQERARIAARTGDGASLAQDPLATRYRRVADALRTPLPDALPADFAARMAQIVQAPAARSTPRWAKPASKAD